MSSSRNVPYVRTSLIFLNFWWGIWLALRSHDQIPASHWCNFYIIWCLESKIHTNCIIWLRTKKSCHIGRNMWFPQFSLCTHIFFVCHHITQFEFIPGNNIIIFFLYLSQSLQFEENISAKEWHEVKIDFARLTPKKLYSLKYLFDLQNILLWMTEKFMCVRIIVDYQYGDASEYKSYFWI